MSVPSPSPKQYGRFNRYSAAEIAEIRAAEQQYQAAKRARQEVRDRLNCPQRIFWDIATGLAGKKPRIEL